MYIYFLATCLLGCEGRGKKTTPLKVRPSLATLSFQTFALHPRPCEGPGWASGHSPADHEDGAGGGIIGQRQSLLQAQLLAATIVAIRAVDAFGVVVAAGAVLHGPQLLGTLLREKATGGSRLRRWRVHHTLSSHLPKRYMGWVPMRQVQSFLWPTNSCVVLDKSLFLSKPQCTHLENGTFVSICLTEL